MSDHVQISVLAVREAESPAALELGSFAALYGGTGEPVEIRVSRKLRCCPFCRAELRADEARVACPACDTWHHRECWEEHGECAIYGCSAPLAPAEEDWELGDWFEDDDFDVEEEPVEFAYRLGYEGNHMRVDSLREARQFARLRSETTRRGIVCYACQGSGGDWQVIARYRNGTQL